MGYRNCPLPCLMVKGSPPKWRSGVLTALLNFGLASRFTVGIWHVTPSRRHGTPLSLLHPRPFPGQYRMAEVIRQLGA
ncbi:MAG: hypothetical protein KBT13_10185 [Bacteroidales bacterium]|nr:hypothetical protein [Candidatus Sodaliphilus limicaballi]